jgi:hypothetical protein
MPKNTIVKILDDYEPIASFVISTREGEKTVEIYPAEELPEEDYLRFLETRADMMVAAEEIARIETAYKRVKGEDETNEDYTKSKPSTKVLTEAQKTMILATRRWIEAICQLPRESLAGKRPDYIMKLYRGIDGSMSAHLEALKEAKLPLEPVTETK